jgi:hypothetical protein
LIGKKVAVIVWGFPNSRRDVILPSSLAPKGPKAIFRPFLKFGQAIVKAIFIKNS